jgi:hypothetical protein
MKSIGLSMLLVVGMFSTSFAQSDDVKTTLANQVQALGQCQRSLGAALGQNADIQSALLKGELVNSAEFLKSLKEKFEKSNEGKSLDENLKVIERKK